jgi:hypothetical protein
MRAITFLRPHLNRRSSHKVMGPQSLKSPNFGNFGTPTWEFRDKKDVCLVERNRVYYKGEGDGFPQVWAVVNLVNPSLPVARFSTKNAPTMH